jgi:protein tyrosine/serine phosphatase
VNNPEVPEELKAEKLAVAKIPGVNYFNNGSDQVPNQKNLDYFYTIMDNPKNYPVLIHCYHGIGRAQLYAALYRMEYEGWSNEEARAQAAFPLRFSSFDDGKPKGEFLKNYKTRKQKRAK